MHEKDYLVVLQALKEIPFGVGRKLLIEYLQGEKDNESVKKNKLHTLTTFGGLAYSKGEINSLIGGLLMKGLIEQASVNDYMKVLKLTRKGESELASPGSANKKTSQVTDQDRKLFEAFDFFLAGFNEEQKKAITSTSKQILCIAGAGSGKTSVLTKRVEFLARYRSVAQQKILAITFTRKARQQMQRRLKACEATDVNVETFNSFCEKILRVHNDKAYDKPMRVVSYGDKIRLVKASLQKINMTLEAAAALYHQDRDMKSKTDEQMMSIFINDVFFVRDYLKLKGKDTSTLPRDSAQSKLVADLCQDIEDLMLRHGLRDYTDQLVDAIKLLRQNPELIPNYDHVLVDEYQDVNSTQIELLGILDCENFFAVGDPRQSIFGWRGSDIRYILDFEESYPESEVIALSHNYRSAPKIVEAINACIEPMSMPPLISATEYEGEARIINFISEQAEHEFVLQRILSSQTKRSEIFVLARTNKQLTAISDMFKARGIKHVIRSEEDQNVIAMEEEIVLATVHAIKGLEADLVFVTGCTPTSFPCKASEHPVVEMVKVEEYDKYEEERRLLYVAMSRAKRELLMTYSGKSPSPFVTRAVLAKIDPMNDSLKQRQVLDYQVKSSSRGIFEALQDWRREKSRELGLPAFMILQDRVLLEIAQKLPILEEELLDIKGMGSSKIRRYGEEIISVVCSAKKH